MTSLTRNNRSNHPDPFFNLARDFFGFEALARPRVERSALSLPLFDFVETEEAYLLRADVPGMSEENIELTVHEGVLKVKASREESGEEEGEKFLVRERRFGQFERSLKLPKDANPEAVEARLDKGVLTIKISKREERKARTIKIG